MLVKEHYLPHLFIKEFHKQCPCKKRTYTFIIIFLNFNDMHCNSGNLLNKISDHLPNFIIVENLNLKMDNKQKIYKRSFENFEEKNFRNDINKLKLKEKIESFNCINNKYKSFHENIMQVINKHAPLKELSNREKKR